MIEPVTISTAAHATMTELARAMQHFELLGRRQRSASAWAYVEIRLWNARAAAIHAGTLNRGSCRYRDVSDRIREAGLRMAHAESLDRTVKS